MLESPKIHKLANGQVAASFGDDKNLFVEFELRPVYQEFLSEESGQQIYKDVEFITISVPGDNKRTFIREVQHNWHNDIPPDSDRWPEQYKAFKNSQLQVTEGTPLSNWPAITKSTALNLKGMNIHSVEHLAAASDTIIQNIFGGAEMRKLAISYLAQAKDGSEVSRLNHQLAIRDNKIATLNNQINDMEVRFKDIESKLANPDSKVAGMPLNIPSPKLEEVQIPGMPLKRKAGRPSQAA